MALRFRRTIKIAPGVRLNISRSGVSTSIGGAGHSINIGSQGTRGTVGIPGTGLSYTTRLSDGGSDGGSGRRQSSGNATGCMWLLLVVFLFVILVKCTSSSNNSGPEQSGSGASLQSVGAPRDLAYFTAKRVNCRRSSATSSPIVTSFEQGTSATVRERGASWTKLESASGDCWVANRLLSNEPVAATTSAPASPTALLSSSSEKSHRSGAGGSREKARHHRASTRRDSYLDEGCPCSGSRICIGPRGGRYCITSGGNKRYGV